MNEIKKWTKKYLTHLMRIERVNRDVFDAKESVIQDFLKFVEKEQSDKMTNQIKDYVWKRLGAPVQIVELDESQFYAILETVKAITKNEIVIKELTYALCLECLGLIRSKFKSIPIPNGNVTMNGEAMINLALKKQKQIFKILNGNCKLKKWKSDVQNS